MRRIIPEKIMKLAKTIEPYMIFDKEKGGFYLRPDAPEQIVQMQKEFHEWMSGNQ